MKKKLLLLPVIALGVCLAACNGYDDSKLWEKVNTLDKKETSGITTGDSGSPYSVHVDNPGTLFTLLTPEQKRSIKSLKISGTINESDMKFINCMLSLENLDLSGAVHPSKLNPMGPYYENYNLRNVVIGILERAHSSYNIPYCPPINIAYCPAIESLTFSCYEVNERIISEPVSSSGFQCFSQVIFLDGVIEILPVTPPSYKPTDQPQDPIQSGLKIDQIILSRTIERICIDLLYHVNDSGRLISMANIPPDLYVRKLVNYSSVQGSLSRWEANNDYHLNEPFLFSLYVPASSVEQYKQHPFWGQIERILPVEELTK